MPIKVHLPNGDVANFPDGTPPAEIEQALADHRGPALEVSSPSAADMLTGKVRVSSDAPAGTMEHLNEALTSLAHPQTAGDMAGLLIPDAGGAPAAINRGSRVVGEAVGTAVNAARGPVGGAVSAMGRGVEAAGKATSLPGRYIGLGTLYNHPMLGAAEIAGPPLMKATGRLMQRVGKAITPAVAEAVPEAVSGVHLDRAVLARPSQMTPQQLTERITSGTGTPAVSTGQVAGQLRPATVPEMPPAVSPMQQPRVAVGAEQVGREMGLSKDAVRQQTGPILGEAAGEASPILPKEPLGRIVDALKALPPGAEREAYVARATSGKAQWQIENIRRTLEHLGLLVPVAVGIEPAIKARLESLMRSGSQ